MNHLDLFSGIGGFAYAIDQVWDNVEHIFCDNDKFCQQVIKKHWPNSKIYEDIRTIKNETADIITGGFPCQPFSQAGKRKGTNDNRYLWPEMFRVIQITQPTWVVAENVYGILNIEGGMVFEQVCTDLEGEGYEVQPFIIPAISVNAPHRRDRVWFVANTNNTGSRAPSNEAIQDRQKDSKERKHSQSRAGRQSEDATDSRQQYGEQGNDERMEENTTKRTTRTDDAQRQGEDDTNTNIERLEGVGKKDTRRSGQLSGNGGNKRWGWNENWIEVATELCGVHDGVSAELDGYKLTKAGHRKERLKSLGNAIVPQVAIEIFTAIKMSEK